MNCNMKCRYCYLGENTNELKSDKGYLETLHNAYESSRNLSAKFRYISDSKKQYENKFNIHD